MFRAPALAGLIGVISLATASAQDSPALRQPLVGKIRPELSANGNDWLAGPAISLQKLQGRVVWLQFNF